MRRRRLLTLSHSYVVTLNRRLARELAAVDGGAWEVTTVAPSMFRGDLGPLKLQPTEGEPPVVGVPVHLARSPHAFVYGAKLREVLRSGWDLVHLWEEPFVAAGFETALLTPSRTPLVFSTFQNLPKRYPPPFAQMERYVVDKARGWIAFGQTVKDCLGDRPGYRDTPSTLIPPGVDVEVFRPDRDAGTDELRKLGWERKGAPVVGYLGRFVPEKGLELLAAALERLRTPWRALFVGGGPMEPWLREFAARRPEQVRVLTGVSHDRVPRVLNAMDLMCAPSQTTPRWREQFGRMLVEAFACGVPVVASDSGEIPHTVGDAGIIVPESDESAWVRELEALLESPQRRTELTERGRARALDTFAWPRVAKRHIDFFESVLP
ncbi:glycosyltransferase family 4 protein [Myxococcaceae bacterium GXIMD 01537]